MLSIQDPFHTVESHDYFVFPALGSSSNTRRTQQKILNREICASTGIVKAMQERYPLEKNKGYLDRFVYQPVLANYVDVLGSVPTNLCTCTKHVWAYFPIYTEHNGYKIEIIDPIPRAKKIRPIKTPSGGFFWT